MAASIKGGVIVGKGRASLMIGKNYVQMHSRPDIIVGCYEIKAGGAHSEQPVPTPYQIVHSDGCGKQARVIQQKNVSKGRCPRDELVVSFIVPLVAPLPDDVGHPPESKTF